MKKNGMNNNCQININIITDYSHKYVLQLNCVTTWKLKIDVALINKKTVDKLWGRTNIQLNMYDKV